MFDKFGEFDSVEELNRAAAGLLKEGDKESLIALAAENGIDKEDVQDYMDGCAEELANPLMAALGKIEIECKELKPKDIMEDWVSYIKVQCADHNEMAIAVRRKGKRIKSCLAKLLVWSLKNAYEVDKEITKEANINFKCSLGIPGMAKAKELIKEYYLG